MKASLESLLAESLGGLRQLGEPVADNTEVVGPVESLTVVTAEQIAQDVTAHIADERYNDCDTAREVCDEYIEQNAAEHAAMRQDIEALSDTVQHVVAAMEMASVVTSMESIDASALVAANSAFANIAQTAGDILPPVLVTEDGQLTTASMEGLGDFLKNLLTRLKKWIKEKYENMVTSMRRGTMARETLVKRVQLLQDRVSRLPEDYGIPHKALRLNPANTFGLYFEGQPLNLSVAELKKAIKAVTAQMQDAVSKIHPDSVKRSEEIGDVIASILVARDGNAAEEAMRKLYKTVTEPLPASKIPTLDKEMAGVTYFDGASNYRSRYRDVEWIMELVTLLEAPAVARRYRKVGKATGEYIEVKVIAEILDELIEMINEPVSTDYGYYGDLVNAWREADQVYGRLWSMVTSMQFAHMDNMLWRAFDIAVTGMFTFLDKAYNNIESLRDPYFRLLSDTLYVLEEQMKGYTAVNR